MADDELEAIRRQRMAELQAKHGETSNSQQEEAKQREQDMRNSILAQVLDQSARARYKYRPHQSLGRNADISYIVKKSNNVRRALYYNVFSVSNLALVKPEKAKAVENYLIQMARLGQLGGKISESGLIEILEKVNQQTEKRTTVKFNRHKVMDSDDDDDN